MVLRGLADLVRMEIDDRNVRIRLRNDEGVRKRYLILYDIVGHLVDLLQKRVSVLATTARKDYLILEFLSLL